MSITALAPTIAPLRASLTARVIARAGREGERRLAAARCFSLRTASARSAGTSTALPRLDEELTIS